MQSASWIIVLAFVVSAFCQTTPAPRPLPAAAAPPTLDKCANVDCKEGEVCDNGACVCMNRCPDEWNNFPRQMCIDDKTYRHECDFWRNKCYCKKSDSRCAGTEFSGHKASLNSIVQYFEACTDLTSMCDWKSEEATFSNRLSVWFRNLYASKWSVPSGKSADTSLLRPINAKTRTNVAKLFNSPSKSESGVHGGYLSFWFCEIDRNNDGSLGRDELARLSQLLNPSTPCLNSFLAKCGSGTISKSAWDSCFKVPKAESMACSNFN